MTSVSHASVFVQQFFSMKNGIKLSFCDDFKLDQSKNPLDSTAYMDAEGCFGGEAHTSSGNLGAELSENCWTISCHCLKVMPVCSHWSECSEHVRLIRFGGLARHLKKQRKLTRYEKVPAASALGGRRDRDLFRQAACPPNDL
ncbi:hypothetical protein GGE45_006066 [Rhizobium aethiopicum]|uniref:Uncharacterized protein n=1 Tax=Rhizobium aethiopicum TaxID=1138170 RepID=A0A7W6QED0_9HYPH|nr:hypothetical protein [Rhizobium aethiopicum]MBB4196000.1 hypothetical protein [Rhizobium aethiopicum]MBB4583687.1 hypothetical protein [Rhizobium aethiopicum]